MNELDNKYIDEAINYKKKPKKPVWIKRIAVAAYFVALIVLGVSLFQNGLFSNRTDVASLNNGNKIVFVQSDNISRALDLDINIITKPLTKTEAEALFKDMPVTAHAIFKNSDIDANHSQELIGFEGKIDNVNIIISTSEIPLVDTVIIGTEKITEVNGTSVVAGYFVTDPNSKGEQNAIYYATFEIGSCKVYLVNANTKKHSETTKNQLVEVMQQLIENGELDLTSYN